MKSWFKVLLACVAIFCCLVLDIHAATTTVTYNYDDQDRLTGVNFGARSTITYDYDDTGNILSVSNQGSSLPEVTTAAITDISTNSALSGGNVISDGGAAVTARGVCWSTTEDPTTTDTKTVDGSGTGSFTSTMTGLLADTRYYVRAYATSASGTGYGDQLEFITYDGNADSDNDGLPDTLEDTMCTDRNDPDSDDDGLLDGEEDINADGYIDENETDPCNDDSDYDEMPDGWEVDNGLDPLVDDALDDNDNDGYTNYEEYKGNSDPNDGDSIPLRKSLVPIYNLLLN